MAFSLRERNGVTFAVSDCLLSRHAFATRLGGVSTLPHTATLNLAFDRGDEREVVLENLRRFAEAAGIDPHTVISVPQVHGVTVLRVDANHAGLGYDRPTDLSGDGYVTTDPGVALGVKTADCTPMLLEARCGGRVAAVAALHAGWKGTISDMAGEGVRALRQAAGPSKEAPITVYAVIGPCIHPCCFEVREDCLSVVRGKLGELAYPYIRREGERQMLDLPGLNAALLERAGVRREHIDISPDCTVCRTDRYYSHRAQNGQRGTLLSVITMA